jgi:uncharacterized protein YdeI (YjbR/CyaY-like superfamily)
MHDVKIFSSQRRFNQWLQKNHNRASELWIGFYNAKSDKKAMTYKEAVDEALCFGWIDGIRKTVDAEVYTNRFTPRKKNSVWSTINTNRMKELIQAGRVHAAGLAAFNARNETRSGVYSFEQSTHQLAPAYEKKFRANKKAWKFFTAKAPWYQRTSIHWVMSAKQELTQCKRLDTLISDSENEKTIALLTRNTKK